MTTGAAGPSIFGTHFTLVAGGERIAGDVLTEVSDRLVEDVVDT